jgi:hypothetical protein
VQAPVLAEKLGSCLTTEEYLPTWDNIGEVTDDN